LDKVRGVNRSKEKQIAQMTRVHRKLDADQTTQNELPEKRCSGLFVQQPKEAKHSQGQEQSEYESRAHSSQGVYVLLEIRSQFVAAFKPDCLLR
jgi:hypothetical protein